MPLIGPDIAVPSDAAALALCHTSAFSSAGPRTLYNLIFSGCSYDAMLALENNVFGESFESDSQSRIVVMRDDDSGEIVSYAHWTLPAADEQKKEPKGNTEEGKGQTNKFEFPDGVNIPLFKRMFFKSEASEAEKRIELPVPREKCWYLKQIGTRPEYQGKGAATALIRWGTDKADAEGKFCMLSTDPEQTAFQAYKKVGFEVVGSVSEIELKSFGATGILKYVRMVRHPQKIK